MPKQVTAGTIELDEANSDLRLGGVAAFHVSTVGNISPRVELLAYDTDDGRLVYGEVRPVTATSRELGTPFDPLGGSSSIWLNEHTGPVHMRATLFYWTFHPQQQYHPLDSCTFDAAG